MLQVTLHVSHVLHSNSSSRAEGIEPVFQQGEGRGALEIQIS